MERAAARRIRIVVYIILLLAGFLLLDMFVTLPIQFASEIALSVALLLLAPFAFAGGYWKMFLWMLLLRTQTVDNSCRSFYRNAARKNLERRQPSCGF